MYPFARFASVILSERRKPPLGVFDTHHMTMRCWPVDLDGFLEMNNGRILTLFDLGRFGLGVRIGLMDVLRARGWGLVVAGSTVRYRARITALQRFEMRSRLLGWDDRFIYLEQAMWRGETCCNHLLIRTGVTRKGRLLPTAELVPHFELPDALPPIPDWASAWMEADAQRPWPPEL